MPPKIVPLYILCKTPNGWNRFPAAVGRNGKVRPHYAQVGHAQLHFPQSRYQIRQVENRKTTWVNVGDDASAAQAEQVLASKRATAKKAASQAGVTVVGAEGSRFDLKKKAKEYEERQRNRNKNRHSVLFRQMVDEFLPIIKVTYADELTETVILRWHKALRKKGNAERTIHNKHMILTAFLRWGEVDLKQIKKADAPTYTEKVVETYTTEQMQKFFASLTDSYHRIVFQTLLKTGMRMQEAMFLHWGDIDFKSGTITISPKDDQGFNIKDRAGRVVPIPSDLVDQLKIWKDEHGGILVLGTSNDTPNWKWLPLLKRLARNAKLNCGVCAGCKGQEECSRWYLHKFRATYTTNLLQAGIDVRTVMSFTGHENLETVLRYIKPATAESTQVKVNAINWGA